MTTDATGGHPGATPERLLVRVLVIGLIVRACLLPFHHPWDYQTWHNMLVDLSQQRSPYDSFRYMSYSTRAHIGQIAGPTRRHIYPRFYESYAYPPLPLVIYYPVAKLIGMLTPLRSELVVQWGIPAHRLNPLTKLGFELPIWCADLAIAVMLFRVGGVAPALAFFLNPLVLIVSGAWTFDAIAAAFVVGGLLAAQRERPALAGTLLALGFLTKWTPAILWPTVAIWLWHRRAPWTAQAAFSGTFIGIALLGVAPIWSDLRFILAFHETRAGANLTPHVLLYALSRYTNANLGFLTQIVSPLVGAVTLPACLIANWILLTKKLMRLSSAAVLTVLAFFLGSKVVNEPYVYLVVPLLLWDNAWLRSPAREFVLKALYSTALAFAVLNVSILAFATPSYLWFKPINLSVFFGPINVTPPSHAAALSALALLFVAFCAYGYQQIYRGEDISEAVLHAPC